MQLTDDQQNAYQEIFQFLRQGKDQVFVLTGYAGTGKTTLVKKVVEELQAQGRPRRLLATTGRAAKVLAQKTGYPAITLHSCLYRFDELTGGTNTSNIQMHFDIKSADDLDENMVFIIDEASMLSHEPSTYSAGITFGTGSVLNDLFTFVNGRQIIFVGDPCQLPPVAESPFSAALSLPFLQNQGLTASGIGLQEVVRQASESEVLRAANDFRRAMQQGYLSKYPKVRYAFGDALNVVNDHHILLEQYIQEVRENGFQQAIMLGYANWQVAMLNQNIRKALYPSAELQNEELLMVIQNNYPAGLANGDQIILSKARFHARRAGFTFLKVKVKALHQQEEKEVLLIRDLLYNKQAGLSRTETQRLVIDFDKRQMKKGVKRKSETYRVAMEKDPYLNALRTKFGYAITCHKAQGGEWPRVYLNIHRSLYALPPEQLYRWYYTALTRAQQNLYLNDGWWIEGFNQRRPEAAAAMYKAAQRRRHERSQNEKNNT